MLSHSWVLRSRYKSKPNCPLLQKSLWPHLDLKPTENLYLDGLSGESLQLYRFHDFKMCSCDEVWSKVSFSSNKMDVYSRKRTKAVHLDPITMQAPQMSFNLCCNLNIFHFLLIFLSKYTFSKFFSKFTFYYFCHLLTSTPHRFTYAICSSAKHMYSIHLFANSRKTISCHVNFGIFYLLGEHVEINICLRLENKIKSTVTYAINW